MRVAVLGCGPAGLMAAHAARLSGADRVDVYSRRRKSELYGAQYLHSPIPGMTDSAPVTVRYVLKGDPEWYRKKVYGRTGGFWEGPVSPEEHDGDHMAWDIRATYNNLWQSYFDQVFGTEISPAWIGNFMEVEGKVRYDHIFSTVPKPLLCQQKDRHHFNSQNVWAAGDAPERGVFVSHLTDGINNNTVVCSGYQTDPWYRIAKVFGYSTVEWPEYAIDYWPDVPPIPSASQLTKPLSNTCDCWPDITHLGRFGKWQKGVLSDSAFQEVTDLMAVAPKS